MKRIIELAVCVGAVFAAACHDQTPRAVAARADTVHGQTTAPAVAHDSAPALIRGVYLNAYAAGSARPLRKLLTLADSTEINTFVIDVKDELGMRYHTQLPLQKQIGGEVTIANLKALLDTVHAHHIWTIARIVVFKDPLLSKARPQWSIRMSGDALWRDKKGVTWVSAWDPEVWEYNIQIAEEVVRAGFDEVQFDYVRFPEPFPSLPPQIHPHAKGDRTDAIAEFLRKAAPRIHASGGVMAADLFGLSPDDPKDVNIGQQWERLLAIADHIEPMTYPSHYLPTHLKGVPRPNEMPYQTIVASVGIGVVRAQRLREQGAHVARVIPWLQGFNAPWISKDFLYGPTEAADQMRGVYDVGLEDWIFWNPGSRYDQIRAAFAKQLEPHARKFAPSPALISQVDLIDKQGARAAREKAVSK